MLGEGEPLTGLPSTVAAWEGGHGGQCDPCCVQNCPRPVRAVLSSTWVGEGGGPQAQTLRRPHNYPDNCDLKTWLTKPPQGYKRAAGVTVGSEEQAVVGFGNGD